MQAENQRLWKQIGNQSHRMLSDSNKFQNSAQSKEKRGKIANQQIEKSAEQSIVIEQLSKLQFSDIKLTSNQNAQSFRCRKPSQQMHIEYVLQQLCNDPPENYNMGKVQTKQVRHDKKEYNQKQRKWCIKLKQVLYTFQDQLMKIKYDVRKQFEKSKQMYFDFLQQFRTVRQQFQNKIRAQEKYGAEKDSELRLLKTLYKQKLDELKQLQGQIKKLKIKAVTDKQQKENLQKINIALEIQKQKLNKQLSDQSEKVFDLEQKLLSFDLRVQQKAKQVVQANSINAKKYNVSFMQNKKSARNSQQLPNIDQMLVDNQGEKKHFNFSQEESPQQQYKALNNRRSIKRKQTFDQYGSTTSSELYKQTAMNMSNSVKKLLTKPSNYTPMASSRDSTPNVSMKTSFNTSYPSQMHNHSQNLSFRAASTYQKQKQRYSPNHCLFYKKSSNTGSEKKTPEVQKISRKLSTIKAQIQKQINSILHY